MFDYKDKWILLDNIEALYPSETRNSFDVLATNERKKNANISHWHRKTQGKRKLTYINMGYFEAVADYRQQMQLKAHAQYDRLFIELEKGLKNTDDIEKVTRAIDKEIKKIFQKYAGISYQSAHEFVAHYLYKNYYFTKLSNRIFAEQLKTFSDCVDDYFEKKQEPTLKDFDNVNEYYDYFEAIRCRDSLVAKGLMSA